MYSCWKRRRRRGIRPLFFPKGFSGWILVKLALKLVRLSLQQVWYHKISLSFTHTRHMFSLQRDKCKITFIDKKISPLKSVIMVRTTLLLGREKTSHAADVYSWEARARSRYWLVISNVTPPKNITQLIDMFPATI